MRVFSKIFQKMFLSPYAEISAFLMVCFPKKLEKFCSFHIYGDFDAVLGACFVKKVSEVLPFSYLRRIAGHFGEVFLEKSFAFHYTEISKPFWTPYLQKNMLFISTEKRKVFCRGVFLKKSKKISLRRI